MIDEFSLRTRITYIIYIYIYILCFHEWTLAPLGWQTARYHAIRKRFAYLPTYRFQDDRSPRVFAARIYALPTLCPYTHTHLFGPSLRVFHAIGSRLRSPSRASRKLFAQSSFKRLLFSGKSKKKTALITKLKIERKKTNLTTRVRITIIPCSYRFV